MDNFTREASGTAELIAENQIAIDQLIQLVTQMDNETYQTLMGRHGQQSVGKHVRHIIDHYTAFLAGAEQDQCWVLDYEHREREAILECSGQAAADRLQQIKAQLNDCCTLHAGQPVFVDYPTANGMAGFGASIGRELAFLTSHTVHHLAVVALLAEQLNYETGPEFGVHPSTLRYWEQQRAAG